MNRTPLAAAIAAVFLISASSLFAQTSGSSQTGTTTPSTPRSTTAPASAGATRSTTGEAMPASNTPGPNANSPTTAGASAVTAPGVPGTTASTAAGDTTRSSRSAKHVTGDTGKLAHRDKKFIEKAAEDGMLEVEIAKLATQKATDAQVKSFAEQMMKDHTDANQKLMSIAQAKGLTLPSALKHSEERELHKLEKLSGAKFDEKFVKDMVKDHKKDAKEFDKEAKSAKDADLKQFAADTAPVIHQHLTTVTDLNNSLHGKGRTHTSATANPPATTPRVSAPATTSSAQPPTSMASNAASSKSSNTGK